MTFPVLVIVGRPNVGKSTLFNRLVGRRQAIVQPEPGVTRDRRYGRGEWEGRAFLAVDTGGISPAETDPFSPLIAEQTASAIAEGDVVLFLADGLEGLLPGDVQIAERVRASEKPVLLAVNKADATRAREALWEFFRLGFGDPRLISAEHGTGVAELVEDALSLAPPGEEAGNEAEEEEVRVAVVGRPNVGKSSLVNRLLGEERALVSPEPGTTRDPVDSLLRRGEQHYRFVDTAGIRKKGKVGGKKVEAVSMIFAYRSIERAEVVLLVVDATEGPRAMDAHIARHIIDSGRACVILLNKWDIIEKDAKTFDAEVRSIHEKLVHLDFAPIISLSALTGLRCERIFEVIKTVSTSYRLRVPTGTLNTVVEKWTQAHPPPSGPDGKRPRIYYATQTSVAPPHFVLFVSRLRRIPTVQYGRYIENRLREKYEFSGTPIRVSFRQRGKELSGGKSRRRDRLAKKKSGK